MGTGVTLLKSKWSSGNLIFTAETNDTGEINFGDGSYDFDFKVFLGGTTEYVQFDVGNSKLYSTVPLEFGSVATNVLTFAESASVSSADSSAIASADGFITVAFGSTIRYLYTYGKPTQGD